jgi:hypothetical protein
MRALHNPERASVAETRPHFLRKIVPVRRQSSGKRTAKARWVQGFRLIGETGFEPATARPPAGAKGFCRARFGALERCRCARVALSCAHFGPRIAPRESARLLPILGACVRPADAKRLPSVRKERSRPALLLFVRSRRVIRMLARSPQQMCLAGTAPCRSSGAWLWRGHRSTQRKPMWLVPVSTASAWRAAGR